MKVIIESFHKGMIIQGELFNIMPSKRGLIITIRKPKINVRHLKELIE